MTPGTDITCSTPCWFRRARDWVLVRRWRWLLRGEPDARLEAIEEMAACRRDVAAALLASTLADADDRVAHAAWQVLRQLGPGASRALCQALSHARPEVRRRAAQALGRLATPEALPALTAALRDAEPGVRLAVRRAQRRLANQAQQPTRQQPTRHGLRAIRSRTARSGARLTPALA